MHINVYVYNYDTVQGCVVIIIIDVQYCCTKHIVHNETCH